MHDSSTRDGGLLRPHAVQFYGSDDSLFATVADFLGAGLVAGQPAIAVLSASHRTGVLIALAERGIDLALARRQGSLVVLDAEDLIPLIMSDGQPDAALFTYHVERLLDQSLRGRGNSIVRVYGEMVELLCKEGRHDAAIRLEALWNWLPSRHRFALLCGYAAAQFTDRPQPFDAICGEHTHVFRDAQAVRI